MRKLSCRRICGALAVLAFLLSAIPGQAQYGIGPQIKPDPVPSEKSIFIRTIQPDPVPGQQPPPKPASERLRELQAERVKLQLQVQQDLLDVARWESEVRRNPKSLTAPIALSTARNTLSIRQDQLRKVEAEINRLLVSATAP